MANVRDHQIVEIDKPKYNFIDSTSLKQMAPLSTVFGFKQGMAVCFLSLTGLGKTESLMALPQSFKIAFLGETYYYDQVKHIGYPPNVENLNKILSISSGHLMIDSLSSIHPGNNPRLGQMGIDLDTFSAMEEMNTLAASRGHIICFTYNPYNEKMLETVTNEIAGRLRVFVTMLPNYKCKVMNPLTRKLSPAINNTDVWEYMIKGYKENVKRERELYPL